MGSLANCVRGRALRNHVRNSVREAAQPVLNIVLIVFIRIVKCYVHVKVFSERSLYDVN